MTTSTQTYVQTKWNLDDLFTAQDSPEMQATLERLDTEVKAFETSREKLSPDISQGEFLEIIKALESITRHAIHVSGYAGLKFSEDTQDQGPQTFMARMQQRMAAIQNKVLFFDIWWKSLDDKPAERLMAGAGGYAYWLEEMRHFKPHTLSEQEEKIVNIKNVTGASALNTLYATFTNRYLFEVEVDGEVKKLNREALMALVQGPDPDLRARAYQELYKVYGDDGPILGQMYQTLVRDWRNEQVDLRHFASPISARNLGNDIPDEVVDTLLEVCRRNAPLFQRYFRLKARWLGLKRLRRYDISAPVGEADKTYDYDTAAEMVLDSFTSFDPQVGALARRMFDEDHIDSEDRPGKRGGAFCASYDPKLTPWVLLNYQGRARDVGTMAHELGHAIHAMLASHHNIFTFHSSLPLAETASTFGEMVLVDRLLASETDADVRRDILFGQMDDAYATIMRQAFFALFERQAHEMIQEGASVDELAAAYMENLQTQFGDSMELSEEFQWEWVSIPHIYQVPFYVYAYAFGQLLVLSLYQQYKAEGEAFKPRYLEILAAGGSDAPVNVLKKAGIDVYDPDFWQGGFDVVEKLLADLEAIPVE